MADALSGFKAHALSGQRLFARLFGLRAVGRSGFEVVEVQNCGE